MAALIPGGGWYANVQVHTQIPVFDPDPGEPGSIPALTAPTLVRVAFWDTDQLPPVPIFLDAVGQFGPLPAAYVLNGFRHIHHAGPADPADRRDHLP